MLDSQLRQLRAQLLRKVMLSVIEYEAATGETVQNLDIPRLRSGGDAPDEILQTSKPERL